MQPYTVIVQNLDKTAALVRHVNAETAREGYVTALREIYEASECDPVEDPFDPEEAERDRPLLCAFAGHHTDLA